MNYCDGNHMPMSPPPRDWVPPEDNRHRKEPSEATIREMQRGAAAIGREYKEGDARRHERMNALRTWQRQGRLRYSTAPDPTTDYMFDTVVVGDEYFSEPTVEFPSEELFARIGLAVNFGGHMPYIPYIWSQKLVEKFYASTVMAAIKGTDD